MRIDLTELERKALKPEMDAYELAKQNISRVLRGITAARGIERDCTLSPDAVYIEVAEVKEENELR